MTSTTEYEEVQVRELFDMVDVVAAVAQAIEVDHPHEAARLVEVSRNALSRAAPVRVPIAARLLLISDKTVRAWVHEGVLVPRMQQPRLLLDTERLHEVLRFLHELRSRGQNRDLLASLWQRLQDEALLDRDDLAESLQQMRAGHTVPALTLDEERAADR